MGAENPDRYLLGHELKGNALLKITGETVMQTITSALVALVLLTGIVGSAQALDARDFYEQVDRYHY
jgi:ABC-type arginine/histidine transport system permease subunit